MMNELEDDDESRIQAGMEEVLIAWPEVSRYIYSPCEYLAILPLTSCYLSKWSARGISETSFTKILIAQARSSSAVPAVG